MSTQEPQPGARMVDDDAACRARRGCAPPTRSRGGRRIALDRVDQLGLGLQAVAGDEAGGAQHPQRIVGEATPRVTAACAAGRRRRSAAPSNGSTRRGLGQGERHRVHGEVAPRQVGLDRVGELDVGLARVRVVGLGAVRRDLERPLAAAGADRAEALALGPDRVGPAVEQALGLGRPGVGREVDSRPLMSRPSSRSRTVPPTRYSGGRPRRSVRRAAAARPAPAASRSGITADARGERATRRLVAVGHPGSLDGDAQILGLVAAAASASRRPTSPSRKSWNRLWSIVCMP